MEIDPQPTPPTPVETTSSADERRLILELEFVQCLANPKYLQFLAQHGYLADPEFINYLAYLQYFLEPEYAQLVVYPYGLEMLVLLQHEGFRRSVALEATVQLIHQKEFYHWQHWRQNERRVVFRQQEELGGSAPALSVEELRRMFAGGNDAVEAKKEEGRVGE
ncbi:Mediator of RNA polymerase II transcription subunit 31 [Podochytrium sp. JEL0797]|nr:Mediator of RNA polymerase II transcription subunit 31 [Podochytrium sp. JEL0797]